MSSFSQRLKQFIDYQNLSVRAFEENCSVTQGVISRCIQNDRTLTTATLASIINRYDELNTDWLLSGKGKMVKGNAVPKADEDLKERLRYQDSLIKTLKETLDILNDQLKRK